MDIDTHATYRYQLETQIREAYGRVVYTYTCHLKCAASSISKDKSIKLAQIILSALTTAGFISIIIENSYWASVAGGLISAILLIVSSMTKSFNLAEEANIHRVTANNLWIIREEYISLLTDFIILHDDDIKDARDSLSRRVHEVYSCSPLTTSRSYKEAQKALKYNEEQMFSDEEIDNMLPPSLRRTSQESQST